MRQITINYDADTSQKLISILEMMTEEEYHAFLEDLFKKGIDEKFDELYPEE